MYLLILHIKTFMDFMSIEDIEEYFCPILLKAYECGNGTL